MNKVILMGRLTRDPDVRYSNGENATAVARFSLAVDRRFKRDGDQKADFISCVAFGKNAEFIEKELVVSHSTARSHIYNIYKKLGISSHQVLINMVEDRKRK